MDCGRLALIMDETLHRVFGFTAFRKHQRELVSGLHEGRDVFGVMPTGGGKSLCYQLPALLCPGILQSPPSSSTSLGSCQ